MILLIEVIEHLDKPKTGLKKLYNILKDDVILFLDTPICDSVSRRARRILYSKTRAKQMKDWDKTHIEGHSKKT